MSHEPFRELWDDAVPAGADCPAVSAADISRRVNAALDAVPSERKRYMRQKLRFAAVLTAAVVALAGTALAVASHWNVLDAFFKGDTSPAQELVDRQPRSVTDQDYTFTVGSSVSDGRNAYLVIRVEALNELSKTKLFSKDFYNMDTFSIYPIADTSEPIPGDIETDKKTGVNIPERTGSMWTSPLPDDGTGTAKSWRIKLSLSGGESLIRARLCYMAPEDVVEVPLTPAESVIVEIGSEGQGLPTLNDRYGGPLNIERITLSPFSCRIEGQTAGDWTKTAPPIFFRLADGSLRTASQLMEYAEGDSLERDGTIVSWSRQYQFKEVQDLTNIAGLVVFGREYPLDGDPAVPAEVDPLLAPFELPLMETLDTQRGGFSVPVRLLCDALGAECIWDNDAKTATCVYRGVTIVLTYRGDTALVDGQTVDLTAPEVQDGRLVASPDLFEDSWGIHFLAPYDQNKTDRVIWVVIP